jgi:hypothetical protein
VYQEVMTELTQKIVRELLDYDPATGVLGYFETFEEACTAREDAERKYGFNENHGARAV